MLLPRRRPARIALGVAGGIVVVLGLAQLLLPGLAAQRIRSQLARYGGVKSVSVSAFPAIELLWGDAQSATASAGSLAMEPSQASELLWKARGVRKLDLSAGAMRVGSFALHRVNLRKRGSALYTEGSLTEADLLASLPGSTSMQLVESSSQGVEMRVSGNIFGVGASLDVLLSAQEGKLVAQPQGIPFAGFVKVTLLSAPHLYVQSFALVGSGSADGGGGGSAGTAEGANGDSEYTAHISATLR